MSVEEHEDETVELKDAEKECCHMSQLEWSCGTIEDWRKEFSCIPRDEHCTDCPVFLEIARP